MERKVVCYDEITATWYEKSSMERRSADNGNHGTITALKNVFLSKSWNKTSKCCSVGGRWLAGAKYSEEEDL